MAIDTHGDYFFVSIFYNYIYSIFFIGEKKLNKFIAEAVDRVRIKRQKTSKSQAFEHTKNAFYFGRIVD